MRTGFAIAILCTAVASAFGDYAPPAASGLVVTGMWQFVHADGTITNGTWTHEDVNNVHLMTHEPEAYAKQSGKTGLLAQWWDCKRKRRCTIAEYRNGKENGYLIHWYPTGELQACGTLTNGCWLTYSMWYTNGVPEEIRIPPHWFNWNPDGTKDGDSPTSQVHTISNRADAL